MATKKKIRARPVEYGAKPGQKRRRRPAPADRPQSLTGHLGELRDRFLSAMLVVVGASTAVFFFRDAALEYLAAPAEKLIFTAPAEAFFAFLKLSMAGGVVLAAPWILWQAYAFVAPAVEKRDRPLLAVGLAVCLGLFYAGGAFALGILRPAMDFFLSFAGERLNAAIRIDDYFSFVVTLVLAFGFVFEMPVLVFVLARLGLVDSRQLALRWREAVVGILIVSALLTPADVFTMMAMALPMSLLYILSIFVARWAGR